MFFGIYLNSRVVSLILNHQDQICDIWALRMEKFSAHQRDFHS